MRPPFPDDKDSLPSPYYFCPVPEHVWFPDAGAPWMQQRPLPLQDIPFSDALSGSISLRLTARTPLYIRSAGVHPDQRNDDAAKNNAAFTGFYRLPNGRHAIPATSWEGMLRSVFEIATFSRFQHFADDRHSVRDLHCKDRDYYANWMTDRNDGAFAPKPKAGWLSINGSQWTITPCSYARIEKVYLRDLLTRVTPPPPSEGDRIWAKEKYAKWQSTSAGLFVADHARAHGHPGNKRLHYREAVPQPAWFKDETDSPECHWINGEIVFTGQPNNRKHMEFVFFDEAHAVPAAPVSVPDHLRRDFLDIHSESEDWDWWLNTGRYRSAGRRIPVFYLAHLEENPTAKTPSVALTERGARLHSFGLALMYRLAARHRLRDALPPDHRPDATRLDAADLIFGCSRPGLSLRGRLQPEPLVCPETETAPAQFRPEKPGQLTSLLLGSPKPTFYPAYIAQPDAAGGSILPDQVRPADAGPGWKPRPHHTLMSEAPRLAGTKRYAVVTTEQDGIRQPALRQPPHYENSQSSKLSHFRPLPAGTVFEGAWHFHNLRPWELGALLWAISFGQPQDATLCHRIGMGKPFGYGAVRMEITGLIAAAPGASAPPPSDEQLSHYLGAFRQKLATAAPVLPPASPDTADPVHPFRTAPPIRELLALASSSHAVAPELLAYPALRMGGPNEFADAKKNGRTLPLFSHVSVPANPPLPPGNRGLP